MIHCNMSLLRDYSHAEKVQDMREVLFQPELTEKDAPKQLPDT